MARRELLGNRLVDILGSSEVYFQPPASVSLSYPCIIYSLSSTWDLYADNLFYAGKKRYQIMLITRDPDTPFFDKIRNLPLCGFDRAYVADNLHHFVFEIFW